MASKPVVPQNDNVAHALAGAGGGVLSMVLTYARALPTSNYHFDIDTPSSVRPTGQSESQLN